MSDEPNLQANTSWILYEMLLHLFCPGIQNLWFLEFVVPGFQGLDKLTRRILMGMAI